MTRLWVAPALLLAVGCASTAGRPPTLTPAAGVSPVVTAPPEVVPLGVRPAVDTAPPLVRVLLERTTSEVVLGQPGRCYRATWDGGDGWLWGPLALSPAGEESWQAAAFADPAAAAATADRLAGALGPDAELVVAAGADGLHRVTVRWRGEPPDDPTGLLAAAGMPGAFPIPTGGAVRVAGAAGGVVARGELVLEPQGDWPTAVGQRRYAGRLRARSVAGELLVINELNMERYLKGVVPAEMGPFSFPELEALKAQAVAARTYAVAHLGDHDDEGWDLCATPACQAYHGADAQHQLTDRAVDDTAGIIAVYDGRPIDAMYTSTCGGHTEDAAVLFPDRAQPYLVGVACAWERPLELVGDRGDGPWLPRNALSAELGRSLVGAAAGARSDELLRAVGSLTGVDVGPADRAGVDDFSAALLAATTLSRSTGWLPGDGGLDSLLRLCDLYDVPLDRPVDGLAGDWPAAAVLAALELYGVVARDSGEAVPHPQGVAIYPRRADASEPLPSPLPLWERWQGSYRRVARAELLPGAELERIRCAADGGLLALVVARSGGADEADRRSAWRSWVRERSWDELATRLGVPDMRRLVVTRRGRSGRVVELVAEGASGTTVTVEGFPIRRALDLPENLFTMVVPPARADGAVVRFLGRGWGHGVGLCQNGAYGLARGGRDFEAILTTYYTGISLARWPDEAADVAR